MKRRDFLNISLKSSAVLGMSSVIPALNFDKTYDKHITILHTNDVHSQIDPFPADHHRNANRGGVSRRFSIIKQVLKQNKNTLILDAGDSFQGTPYFNFYGGELEFKLMSKMGYHASTIGNHEFDNGIDNIAAQMEHAKFDMLNANYDFSNTILNGLVKPNQIYEVDGLKIGVFGLGIELEGLVPKKLYKETVYLDPVEIAQDQVNTLKNEYGCDLIICLSHLGYQYKLDTIDDIKLAKQTKDIDLIIGGHTHTFLKEPTYVQNSSGGETIVNQVGFAGLYLGRIDFYFNKDKTVRAKNDVVSL